MGKTQSSTTGRRWRTSMRALPSPQLLCAYWEREKHKFQAGNLLVCSMVAYFCLRMVSRNVSPCCQYVFWFIVQRIMHQYPLHRISYCADDKGEKRFFSFIAKEADSERHMCFVFVSDKLVSNSKTGLHWIVRMKKLIIVMEHVNFNLLAPNIDSPCYSVVLTTPNVRYRRWPLNSISYAALI